VHAPVAAKAWASKTSSWPHPARWEVTWALVRSKLAELGRLGHAMVEVYLDLDSGDPPRPLWPPPMIHLHP
jgi:hypothetical protein